MKIESAWIEFVRVVGTDVYQWALRFDGKHTMYKIIGTTERVSRGKHRYCTFDRRQAGYVSSKEKAVRLLYSYLELAPHERKQVVLEMKPNKEGLERRLPAPPNFREMR